ncbi:Hypothetical protein R9X50_00282100 [Acrodontium crateriforme]|uniref:Uncharacterized protein n=1 Tax=Acrodontium crateriforme TaxID=150365 RepID=A0AAQ3RBB3_9PEZI|nr:Hypothetical protein R9X50_00282100 [Acrodontium crateriforme]
MSKYTKGMTRAEAAEHEARVQRLIEAVDSVTISNRGNHNAASGRPWTDDERSFLIEKIIENGFPGDKLVNGCTWQALADALNQHFAGVPLPPNSQATIPQGRTDRTMVAVRFEMRKFWQNEMIDERLEAQDHIPGIEIDWTHQPQNEPQNGEKAESNEEVDEYFETQEVSSDNESDWTDELESEPPSEDDAESTPEVE